MADRCTLIGEHIPSPTYNATGQRVVYAFDVVTNPGGKYFINKRPIWLTQEYVPDGIKVARTGEVLVAAGAGSVLSVFLTLDPSPAILVSLQTHAVSGLHEYSN